MATFSVAAAGTLATQAPCAVAAGTSTMSTPTDYVAMMRSRGNGCSSARSTGE